jgi:putative hydrolase of the HAD superfamily
MNNSNRVVLFDLGGVLADLGEPTRAIGLDLPEEQFWQIWLNSPHVHAFERGKLSAHEFFARVADEFGQADVEDFENRLRGWHLNLFPGAEELIQFVSMKHRVALLSNTNAVHWDQVTGVTGIFSTFDRLFLSFETGHYKPEAIAYEQVVTHFDCEPADVFFLDDSPHNIMAARELGFDAHQVRGIGEVRAIISQA